MIARNIFSKFVDYIKAFFKFLFDIPTLLKKQFQLFIENFHKIKYNFKHFAEANIELGIYHLYNQNYNDALFRFKIVDKFFRPYEPYVQYLIGIAYFLKGNKEKSIIFLEKGESEDKPGLLKFIKELPNVTKVPDKIYAMHRDIIAGSFADKFANKKDYDLPKDLVIRLMLDIDKLPEEYSVLDLGSNAGLLGAELRKRMQEKFTLTGVEAAGEMIDLKNRCFPGVNYDEMINLPLLDFLISAQNRKYNIVVSLDGFSSNSDLSEVFSKIYDILVLDGYFAFVIRISKSTSFSEKYLEFSYDKDYVMGLLEQVGFKNTSCIELDLAIKNNYCIFICKKL